MNDIANYLTVVPNSPEFSKVKNIYFLNKSIEILSEEKAFQLNNGENVELVFYQYNHSLLAVNFKSDFSVYYLNFDVYSWDTKN